MLPAITPDDITMEGFCTNNAEDLSRDLDIEILEIGHGCEL